MHVKPAVLSCLVFGMSVFPVAGQAGEVNTGYFGSIAIKGYDTVAYHTDGKATKGSKSHSQEWLGATWLFASSENRQLFAEDPVKYAPRYGGHCSAGVSRGGATVNVDPEAWSIVDGKLYLNFSKSVRALWEEKKIERIAKADANWENVRTRIRSQ